MLRYETLVLASTHITDDEISSIENYFDKTLSGIDGKVISFEKWGKYRLAYPVKKNDYGIYILVRYEVPKDKAKNIFKDIDSFFRIKCHEIVFRTVTLKLDEEKSLEYKRPEAVDSRSGNLDTFIKENKMESLLDKPYASKESKDKDSKVTESEDKEVDSAAQEADTKVSSEEESEK